MIPYPRLLDSSCNEVRRLMPVDVSINEEIIPLSHASMTLRSGDSIPERSYIELFTPNGSAGIYRSRVPREGYGDLSVNIELEHAIVEVGDYLFKESLEAELGLSEAFTRAFSHYGGDLWRLGSIPNDVRVILNADHDNVLEVMLDLLEQAPQYYMTFDFSVRPWRINVVQKPTNVSAEGRLSRNVKSARISKDDSNLCTRLFMEGLPKVGNESIGHIDADTIGIYGLVEREISGSKDYTEAQARRVAETYLEANKHPRLSVSINGIDFSSITGESLDRVALGKRYRLVVDGVSTEENITAIAWNSVYNDPTVFTITLAQGEDTVIEFMHNQDKKGGKSGKKLAQANEELYWEMTSENGLLHSEIRATAQSLTSDYTAKVGTMGVVLEGKITQTAYSLTSDYTNKILQTESHIEQTATGIRAYVQDTARGLEAGIQAGTNEAKMYARSAENAAEIVARINASTGDSEIRLDAQKVYIGNNRSTTVINGKLNASDVTADYIAGKIAQISDIAIQYLHSDRGGINVNSVSANTYYQGGVSCYLPHAIWALQIVQNGNNYTLQRQRYGDSGWVDVGSFSRATSLSGSWSSGVLKVTASPQGNTYSDAVQGGSESWSNGICTIPIEHSTNGVNWYGVGASAYASVSKSDISIPTNWSSSSSDPDADVKVSLPASYKYHKCTINVHGRTKTLRVYLMS